MGVAGLATTSATAPYTSSQQANASSSSVSSIKKSINVTPLAHTFIVSKNGDAKPIRENDATRLLTNAKIVFLFYDHNDNNVDKVTKEILELTQKRKLGQGAGVTPGRLCYASL